MVSIKSVATGNVVKSASVVETMGAAVIGGAANTAIKTMLPGVPPAVTSVGMIIGGVLVGSILPGKLGSITQNGLTITGAVRLSDIAVSAITGMMGGSKPASGANPVIY